MEGIDQIYYVVGILGVLVSSIVVPILWVNKQFEKVQATIREFEGHHDVKAEGIRDRIIVLESTKDHHSKRLDDLTDTTKDIWRAVSEIKDDISKNHIETLVAIQGAIK